MKRMTYDPYGGTYIYNAAMEAISLAKKHNKLVLFEFNGITLRAKRNSDPKQISNAFFRLHKVRYDAWVAKRQAVQS